MDAPEAIKLMEVVAQVSVPLVGVTPTDGAVVFEVTVMKAVEVHPLEPVTVTV